MTAMTYNASRILNLDEVPLSALRSATREALRTHLNSIKLIPSEDGHLRDWRGLAELVGVRIAPNQHNPIDSVLNAWECSATNGNQPTFGVLQAFLGQIDRWDVYDDTKELMVKDAEAYINRTTEQSLTPLISERDIITVDDLNCYNQGLPLAKYDAFVLYVEQDSDFAMNIVSILESEFHLKLCYRDRDLIGGVFEHDAIRRLIANRCSRLIVIISPDFIDSEAHTFFFKFAEALSIDQGHRKIVPCVHRRFVEIPPEFKFYFSLDYSKFPSLNDFCSRLRQSIKPLENGRLPAIQAPVSISVSNYNSTERCTIEEVVSEISSNSVQVPTQVVRMSDPSAFLSPLKEKCSTEDSAEASSASESSGTHLLASKPRSPVTKIKKILMGNKTSNPSENTTVKVKSCNPEVKSKRKWFKKKIALAES